MKKYDVIIVGAGPGGIASAKVLKDNNINFCIIDKNEFPREKLCGGGLTNKSYVLYKKLGFDISQCKSTKINDIDLIYSNSICNINLSDGITMIDRYEFDYCNLKQVVDNNLFELENITKIEDNILITDKDKYEFKYIIFADGVNGYSRRLIKNREFGVCVECEVKTQKINTVIDFKAIKAGYGWVFFKGNHATIGLGNFNKKKEDYIKLLIDFARKNKFEITKENIKGYEIPVFSRKTYNQSVIDNNKILIGDAAALVDKMTGEGIYYAMASGKFAAESIILNINNQDDLKSIYFNKTKQLYKSLCKRSIFSKILYSKCGNFFIRLGLTNMFVDKIKHALG